LSIQEKENEMMTPEINLSTPQQSSERTEIPTPKPYSYYQTSFRFRPRPGGSVEALQSILRQMAETDLPGKGHVESYLRRLVRGNRRPRTLYSRWGTLRIFLEILRDEGKTRFEEINRRDMEAFIEHEQDRGIKITTIRMRLTGVQSFLRYLEEEGIVSRDVFFGRIRLQMPERLPRAMDPDDLQKLLSVIEGRRDRAMILVLLRTGMRIGELLHTKVTDVHIQERRIEIYEAQKNRLGRVVYLSDDAVTALKAWLKDRYTWPEYLFYGQRGADPMSYSTARSRFEKYSSKAELAHKGYSLHTLRHTFATELLNAGMRLECLQVLLGHHNIEETRRYARLSDRTREEEYFRAMDKIEKGEHCGADRCDSQLEAVLEEAQLRPQYR
jgi:integrase/recombinase XerD